MKKSEVEKGMDRDRQWIKEESEKRGMPFVEYKSVAVGYLDITEEYQKGIVSQNFINKLRQIWDSGIKLMSLGHHTCEFCGKATGSCEKVLRDRENRIEYMFPEMIFHYIEEHGYQPPEDFVMFVLKLDISKLATSFYGGTQ